MFRKHEASILATLLLGLGAIGAPSVSGAQPFVPASPKIKATVAPPEEIGDRAEYYDQFGSAVATGDFNGDGLDDLAVGASGETVSGLWFAGAVNVVYGTRSSTDGLGTNGNQVWKAGGTLGAPDRPVEAATDAAAGAGGQYNADFGRALASGDFNCDGFQDLAIGAPRGGASDEAGYVALLYGSPDGLRNDRGGYGILDQNLLAGTAERRDLFGAVLAAGNFDGDTAMSWDPRSRGWARYACDDLAIGAPGDEARPPVGTLAGLSGAVNVVYGSRSGLTRIGNLRLAEAGWTRQEYGASLASGDFDGDGFTDLAIGVPSADSMGKIPSIGVDKLVVVRDTGSVFVHYGSSGGLSSQGYGFSQAGAVPGKAETNDRFGAALAAGDLDGNGADDLAIGVPGEDISYSCGGAQCVTTSFRDAGFVVVLKGVRGVRPLLAGREWNPPGRDGVEGGIGLRQDVPTRRGDNGGFVTASVAAYERFGTTLAIGDFNGDSRDDLAIGTPYEQVGAVRHAGTVTVLHGSPLGPLAPFTASARAVVFHQDMGAVADVAEPYDRFGFALAAGDFNGDGFSELAVGIRDEDLRSCSWDPRYGQRCSTVRNAGAVSVLRGTRWRLAGTNGGGLWHQDR